MRRLLPALTALLLLLSGCAVGGLNARGTAEAPPEYQEESDPLGDDDDAASGDDDDGGAEGAPELYNLDPAPGSDTHHYRRPLTVVFTEEATGTGVTLTGPDGIAVPTDLRWSEDGRRVVVHPLPRLEPITPYDVRLGSGSQSIQYSFTTSPVGLLDGDIDLTGVVYALDASTSTLVAPAGVGANTDLATSGELLLQIGEVVLDEAALGVGLGVDDEGDWSQDTCAEAGPVEVVGGSLLMERALVSGTADLVVFGLGDAEVALEEATLAFDVLPSGDGVAELDLSGWLREESLGALLGVENGCEVTADEASAQCAPCPGGDGQCLYVEIEGVHGAEVPVELQSVGPSELDACPEGPTAWLGCSAAGGSGGWLSVALAALALGFRRRDA